MNQFCTSILLALLVFTSCSKDHGESPEPNYDLTLRSFKAFMTPYDNGKPLSALKFLWNMESHNADGSISRRTYRSTYALDEGCSCINDEKYIYTGGILDERYVKSSTWTPIRYKYIYSNDRISEMEEYLNSGELYAINRYEYEGRTSPSRMLYYYPDQSSHFAQHIYTYDEKERLVRERVIYFNDVEHTKEWVYDENDNLTRETLNAPGRAAPLVVEHNKYTYDSKGRITVREFSTDLGFNPQKWVYHYDDEKGANSEYVKKIDILEAIAPNVYDLVGVISYEYTFAKK